MIELCGPPPQVFCFIHSRYILIPQYADDNNISWCSIRLTFEKKQLCDVEAEPHNDIFLQLLVITMYYILSFFLIISNPAITHTWQTYIFCGDKFESCKAIHVSLDYSGGEITGAGRLEREDETCLLEISPHVWVNNNFKAGDDVWAGVAPARPSNLKNARPAGVRQREQCQRDAGAVLGQRRRALARHRAGVFCHRAGSARKARQNKWTHPECAPREVEGRAKLMAFTRPIELTWAQGDGVWRLCRHRDDGPCWPAHGHSDWTLCRPSASDRARLSSPFWIAPCRCKLGRWSGDVGPPSGHQNHNVLMVGWGHQSMFAVSAVCCSSFASTYKRVFPLWLSGEWASETLATQRTSVWKNQCSSIRTKTSLAWADHALLSLLPPTHCFVRFAVSCILYTRYLFLMSCQDKNCSLSYPAVEFFSFNFSRSNLSNTWCFSRKVFFRCMLAPFKPLKHQSLLKSFLFFSLACQIRYDSLNKTCVLINKQCKCSISNLAEWVLFAHLKWWMTKI